MKGPESGKAFFAPNKIEHEELLTLLASGATEAVHYICPRLQPSRIRRSLSSRRGGICPSSEIKTDVTLGEKF